MIPGTDEMPDFEDQARFGRLRKGWGWIKSWKDDKLKSLRSWGEFFDAKKFSIPSKSEAFGRVTHNLGYFYSNYLIVAFLVAIYYLVTNILFMISIIVVSYAWYSYRNRKGPVHLGNTEVSGVQGYLGLTVGTLLLFYLTSASSTVFWLLTVAAFVCVVHAWAREPGIDFSGASENPFDSIPSV
uniref:PRA1 family protein n=1 Tax=Eutreptiella gymnastica TaxID=73025 RepID=A0A7S1NDI7_9EUGL|mmetsp:Transcript_15925/g.28205  ORF Transcript_15925/g.28205 Transcript_15925/m.28205 type:complete len:184 (+) Transcript_15925:18-569(+)